MTRSECWMTFSEALESYLTCREGQRTVGPGRNWDAFEREMKIAAAHMDALTTPPSDEDFTNYGVRP